MSKKLREQCGYSTAQQKSCGNCAEFTTKTELPRWMKEDNEKRKNEGEQPRFNVAVHGVEKQLRCAKYGFAVTKSARCNDWKKKEN